MADESKDGTKMVCLKMKAVDRSRIQRLAVKLEQTKSSVMRRAVKELAEREGVE